MQPCQRRTHSFCPVGTTGPAGRCHCWVEQGLTKSFLLPGRKNFHEISGKRGKRKEKREKAKRKLIVVALAASAVPILRKPKSVLVLEKGL